MKADKAALDDLLTYFQNKLAGKDVSAPVIHNISTANLGATGGGRTDDENALTPTATSTSPRDEENSSVEKIIEGISTSSAENNEKLSELHNELDNRTADMRKDLSEMAQLVEALSSELKLTKDHVRQLAAASKDKTIDREAINTEFSSAIEKLSSQYADVLRKKADISVIENLLNDREAERKNELEGLQHTLDRKASHDELLHMKRLLERDLQRSVLKSQQQALGDAVDHADAGDIKTSLGRLPFKCIACNRETSGVTEAPGSNHFPLPPTIDLMQREAWFDLAPQIAFKRWRVKDIMKNKYPTLSAAPSPVVRPGPAPEPAPSLLRSKPQLRPPPSPSGRKSPALGAPPAGAQTQTTLPLLGEPPAVTNTHTE
eukprot:TRINITY_DN4310_c0_g1_i3.p1 TRINITY_DN4310_c0_g1~~TRINITY_DN4310_c0_g1_i3.p1  ORF type:complete len:375 (+),score=114.22 TRINITY_DN4310_c0_g1_i3:161-1285(+)